jgi:hypothetical protein
MSSNVLQSDANFFSTDTVDISIELVYNIWTYTCYHINIVSLQSWIKYFAYIFSVILKKIQINKYIDRNVDIYLIIHYKGVEVY